MGSQAAKSRPSIKIRKTKSQGPTTGKSRNTEKRNYMTLRHFKNTINILITIYLGVNCLKHPFSFWSPLFNINIFFMKDHLWSTESIFNMLLISEHEFHFDTDHPYFKIEFILETKIYTRSTIKLSNFKVYKIDNTITTILSLLLNVCSFIK